jgi:hypothetical protein
MAKSLEYRNLILNIYLTTSGSSGLKEVIQAAVNRWAGNIVYHYDGDITDKDKVEEMLCRYSII